MRSLPSTQDRCRILLQKWRRELVLSNREHSQLQGELIALDQQLERFMNRRLRLAVFGRVGVGKSSLLNALLKKNIFATDVAHGSTRKSKIVRWNQSIKNLNTVELLDTPGIDEIGEAGRARLSSRIAMQSDVILLVIDSDLTRVEQKSLQALLKSGKPVLLVLNRCDQWSSEEQTKLIRSIRRRLPPEAQKLHIEAVSAAPREVQLHHNGLARSQPIPPQIETLRLFLIKFLTSQGELLLALNALRRSDNFCQSLSRKNLYHKKVAAQGLIGRFAAMKASVVAANPLLLVDIAGGLACDATLVFQLCKLYGIQIKGPAARSLLTHLSGQNVLLGGAQVTIQITLSTIKNLLIMAAPFTGGLSLAPAAPIAVAQAALAVHTTQVTGRLTAQEVLNNQHCTNARPEAMLKRLAASDPEIRSWLNNWPNAINNQPDQLRALLP